MPLVVIITPCYNEGAVVSIFLKNLEQVLERLPFTFKVIVVDDGSADDTSFILNNFQFAAPNCALEVVSLTENTGHQNAIYRGMVHAMAYQCCRYIIMDSDGEDSPAVIPRLLAFHDTDVVHVVRSGRNESVLFRGCYYCYRGMFRLITGRQMSFGNFCCINRHALELAVHRRFSHLAAFLSKQELNTGFVTAKKEQRIGGRSKMSFAKLLRHAVLSFIESGYSRKPQAFRKTVSR